MHYVATVKAIILATEVTLIKLNSGQTTMIETFWP